MVTRPVVRHARDFADGSWYRLHPVTPLLQGGVVFASLLAAAFAALWESIILPLFLGFIGVVDQEPDSFIVDLIADSLALVALGLVVLLAIVGVVFWLQWRVHLVRMDSEVIEVTKGLIAKKSRQARRDRVNTIGVRRPLIPRLFGLAKLDIQAAGNDANLVLAYLPHQLAQEIRREILEPSSSGEHEPAAQLVTREVEVSLFRYLASLVMSVETIVLGSVITGVSIFAVWVGELAPWIAVVLALFVYVLYLADRFLRVGNFTIDSLEGDIRVSLGLLSTSVETIPPPRIHALGISQPWPWRVFGWWRIHANLASTPGAQTNKAPAHELILPVATAAEMHRVVQLCLPSLADPSSGELIDTVLSQPHRVWPADSRAQSITSPSRARFRIPLSWGVNAALYSHGVVFVRTGVWVKRLALVPLERIQSAGVGRGPWQRALGLRSFSLHSVSGPVPTRVLAVDENEVMTWWEQTNARMVGAIGQGARTRSKRPSTSA